MKNINYIVNGVLALAVVILFILQFSGKKESDARAFSPASTGEVAAVLPVAYVNLDSLYLNYNYSKDLNEIILKKEEESRTTLNQRASTLEREAQEFERKVQNNGFLTRQRAEEEQQRLMGLQQSLQELNDRLTNELVVEQQRLNQQLRDTLTSQLKVFNQTKGYQIIFSNTMGDNILLADDVYDVTAELIVFLNKNYTPSK